jgi:type IX secretion system substrate protein
MRIIYTLTLLLFTITFLEAQNKAQEIPLESNTELQRAAALQSITIDKKLVRLFGEDKAVSRSVVADCEDDGVYLSGETVYVFSGETKEVCLDTTGFVTFTNLSVDGNSGMVTTQENCFIYVADPGVDLGLGDTLRVELCLPEPGGCTIRTFPVVVIREGESFIEDATSLPSESDVILCVDPTNFSLPGGIATSSILDCHDPALANVSNGNKQDSCALLISNRFAGQDTMCLEISNDYCISDTFKFPFRVIGDTVDLPFLDDFSYDGPYPNNLWLDKNAYVNNRWGYQPPTVGFATMDGLDANGRPYGGGYGRADFLTSNYIDLSPYTAASDIYLSCYVERKGYGYYPNEPDSLVVEFKKSNGDWVQIHSFQGFDGYVDVDSLPAFDDYFTFHIISSSYLYKGFQFRFVNYDSRIGIRDIWHIDNVRLTVNEIPNGTFEDIAFTNIPNDILEQYSSVPWRHFENDMLIDSIDIELYSQFDVIETANPSSLKITELETGTLVFDSPVLLLTEVIAPENQRNVPPKVHKFHTNKLNTETLPNFTEEKLVFEMEYQIEVDGENPGLFPIVARNNTVRSRTIFDNYFAYDDGSAELAMFVGESSGESVASVFTALEDDTLRAIQILFPHYSNQTAARFNIKVHVGELGNVVYEKFGVKPFFADAVLDTLQGYTTYRLTDDFEEASPVAIPAGDFYIELEQATSVQPTIIGLDKNTPKAKMYQYRKLSGVWNTLGNLGAVMLRPVVGSFSPPSTAVEEHEKEILNITLYPNPTTGIINFDIRDKVVDYEITAFNAVGQMLIRKQLVENSIDLSAFENGIYYIQLKNLETNQFVTHKVVVFKN